MWHAFHEHPVYVTLIISTYLQEEEPEGMSSFGSPFSSLSRLQKEEDVVEFFCNYFSDTAVLTDKVPFC